MAFNSEEAMNAKAERMLNEAQESSKLDVDEYQDQSLGEELSRADVNKMAIRSLALQASFNYERMQAGGWLYGLNPALRKIRKNDTDMSCSMQPHMEFFNTHPFLVSFIIGVVLAM